MVGMYQHCTNNIGRNGVDVCRENWKFIIWCSRPLHNFRELKHARFETRAATVSELFSRLTCLHTTTFTLLSIFSPLEMIGIQIWQTPLSWQAECSLPVAVRACLSSLTSNSLNSCRCQDKSGKEMYKIVKRTCGAVQRHCFCSLSLFFHGVLVAVVAVFAWAPHFETGSIINKSSCTV